MSVIHVETIAYKYLPNLSPFHTLYMYIPILYFMTSVTLYQSMDRLELNFTHQLIYIIYVIHWVFHHVTTEL